MAVKIRLQRKGKKRKPFYHIVVADARAPRDGRFIEKIGTYNPLTVPATIELDREKAFDWITKGAQPTETVRAILRFKGVKYRKHLERGVKKGALTQEQAETMYNQWIEAKEAKISKRREKAIEEKMAIHATIAGLDKPMPTIVKEVPKVEIKEEEPVEEVTEESAEETASETDESSTEDSTQETTPE